jgi:hypothetical protein
MRDKILLVLFFAIVVISFVCMTLSVTRVFVDSVNTATQGYFPVDDGARE